MTFKRYSIYCFAFFLLHRSTVTKSFERNKIHGTCNTALLEQSKTSLPLFPFRILDDKGEKKERKKRYNKTKTGKRWNLCVRAKDASLLFICEMAFNSDDGKISPQNSPTTFIGWSGKSFETMLGDMEREDVD